MTLNSEPSRANEIWKRFAGMFGADALARKFGETPPPEWRVMLDRLKEFEIDRGVRRLAYSGKNHVPSLPEFTKLCRMVADDDVDEGPNRIALPSPHEWQGDGWDVAANLRLLNLIRTLLSKNSKALGKVLPCREVFKNGKRLHLQSQASDEQEWSTAVLVAYKKAWAQDMREWGVNAETGEFLKPTPAECDRTWNSTMARAMAEIAQRISQ